MSKLPGLRQGVGSCAPKLNTNLLLLPKLRLPAESEKYIILLIEMVELIVYCYLEKENEESKDKIKIIN